MHEYMPTGNRGRLKIACFITFMAAVLLFFTSSIEGILYPAAMQFAAVLIMTVVIMLMGRYLMRCYLYRIADDGEGMDFTVDEVSKRGRYTVCRLALSSLVDCKPWNNETKPPRGKKIYNYCVDIRPRDSYVLTFADGDDFIYIRLSPDEKMITIFGEILAARRVEVDAQ